MNHEPINILLVEDNPDHVLLTVEALQDSNVLAGQFRRICPQGAGGEALLVADQYTTATPITCSV